MPRYIPEELHIGQTILVHPNPTHYPMEAIVTYIDTVKGLIHVKFESMDGRFAVLPRGISNLDGLYLHFKNKQFFFSPEPFFQN
jgi:hypothetical protein